MRATQSGHCPFLLKHHKGGQIHSAVDGRMFSASTLTERMLPPLLLLLKWMMMVKTRNRETAALHRLVPSVPRIERSLETCGDVRHPTSAGDGNREQR